VSDFYELNELYDLWGDGLSSRKSDDFLGVKKAVFPGSVVGIVVRIYVFDFRIYK
jgi:hypothetical protein